MPPFMLAALEAHIQTSERKGRILGQVASDQAYLEAAKAFRRRLTKRAGRPRDEALRHAVGAYMALLTEKSGIGVTTTRNADGDLRLAGSLGRTMTILVEFMAPEVTEVQLANLVRGLRREYAGKPMHFRAFCPFYGATVTPH